MQQSADPLQLPDGKSFIQLSVPQLRFPAHSESLSQSPPPKLHGLELEQQAQSIEGIPLQPFGGGVVVAAVDAAKQNKIQLSPFTVTTVCVSEYTQILIIEVTITS